MPGNEPAAGENGALSCAVRDCFPFPLAVLCRLSAFPIAGDGALCGGLAAGVMDHHARGFPSSGDCNLANAGPVRHEGLRHSHPPRMPGESDNPRGFSARLQDGVYGVSGYAVALDFPAAPDSAKERGGVVGRRPARPFGDGGGRLLAQEQNAPLALLVGFGAGYVESSGVVRLAGKIPHAECGAFAAAEQALAENADDGNVPGRANVIVPRGDGDNGREVGFGHSPRLRLPFPLGGAHAPVSPDNGTDGGGGGRVGLSAFAVGATNGGQRDIQGRWRNALADSVLQERGDGGRAGGECGLPLAGGECGECLQDSGVGPRGAFGVGMPGGVGGLPEQVAHRRNRQPRRDCDEVSFHGCFVFRVCLNGGCLTTANFCLRMLSDGNGGNSHYYKTQHLFWLKRPPVL